MAATSESRRRWFRSNCKGIGLFIGNVVVEKTVVVFPAPWRMSSSRATGFLAPCPAKPGSRPGSVPCRRRFQTR